MAYIGGATVHMNGAVEFHGGAMKGCDALMITSNELD
jgi:hypothetical protein